MTARYPALLVALSSLVTQTQSYRPLSEAATWGRLRELNTESGRTSWETSATVRLNRGEGGYCYYRL